jgi:hypothetical protein
MQTPSRFLGMVRVWRDGEQWKWVPVGQWAPVEAVIAKRYRADGEEIIAIEDGGAREFVRGAVKG